MRPDVDIASEIDLILARVPSASVGVACLAPDGRFLAVSGSFCETVGRQEPELFGMRFIELVHPADRDAYTDLAARLAGSVPALEVRNRLLHGDGRTLWCQCSVSAVADERGTPEYLVLLAQDVTEWRSAQEQNAQLFDFPLALVFVAGLDGYFKRVGAGYERLLGWTEAELLSRPFVEFVHPDDAARFGGAIEEVATGRTELINQEIRALCRDGTYRWVMGNYRPLLDEGVMYGMAVDISERKLTEEALRDVERRTRLIIDAAYEAFISIDLEGRIMEWNAEAERVFGWPRKETLGRLLVDIIVPLRYRDAHAAGLEHYRATGEGPVLGQRMELAALRRDGSEFPVELTISPARTDTTVVFNAFLRDITERKRAEDALRSAKAYAERASAEAERANRAKSEFLSGMSHELRTPLNAILGFAQILQLEDLGRDRNDSVEHILRAGQHLLRLIEELLDVARIEEGKVSLSIEPVHLDDVVRGALELIRPLAAAGNIRIWTEASQFHRHVLADAQRLKQVLMNLLSNAVKYNRRGGSVTVSCEPTSLGRLRISVSDTGPGIPQEQMELVFLPFERLGAEQSSVEGTGIGLSISKRLVELMGGQIGVESDVDQGSTFWVELDSADGPEVHDEMTSVSTPAAHAGSRTGPTVLYVEDNLSNLRLVERILQRRPTVQLVAAVHGELGVELAREHQPDLILLDVHLPDIDGDEVLRRLQADPLTRSIRVVVVSAEATPAKIKRFLAAGAHAYLTKPLDVNRLLEIIDEVQASHGDAHPPVPMPENTDNRPLDEELIAPLRELHNLPPGGRLTQVAALFVDESARRLTAARAALAIGDTEAVEQVARALKGTSADLGASALSELYGRLERLAASEDLADAAALLNTIEAELARVHIALQDEFPPAG